MQYSDDSDRDLESIHNHVARTLCSPETAAELIVRILKAANSLEFMPFRHPVYEYEPWHSMGVRVLPIDNFLILYLPDKQQNIVDIVRIVYGRRNMENI
jgi:toxin ParE1/3/4